MKRNAILIICVFSILFAPSIAYCSGSYSSGAGKSYSSTNQKKYALGKKIFTRRRKLDDFRYGGKYQAQQKKDLQTLQDKLPAHVQLRVDLPGMAGKLAPDQFEALLHYIAVRYQIEVQAQ